MITITSTRYEPASRTVPAPVAAPMVFVVGGEASARASLHGLAQVSGWRAETLGSAQECLARTPARVPSCLVLDIAMSHVDGLDAQRRLALDRPSMPLVLTGCADVRVAVQAMKAGAVEFLTTPWRDEAMLHAIEDALDRSRHLLEREAQLLELHASYRSLTPREREVMVLVVSGLLNKQVAGELGISEITVKAHRGQVMRKMKAASLPALVRMVGDLGLPTTVG
jgi:FixJ family two-component response regulator